MRDYCEDSVRELRKALSTILLHTRPQGWYSPHLWCSLSCCICCCCWFIPATGVLGTLQLWNLRSVFLSVPRLNQHVRTSLGGFRNAFISSLDWGGQHLVVQPPGPVSMGLPSTSASLLLCQKPPFSGPHSGARYKVFLCFSVPLGSGCQD